MNVSSRQQDRQIKKLNNRVLNQPTRTYQISNALHTLFQREIPPEKKRETIKYLLPYELAGGFLCYIFVLVFSEGLGNPVLTALMLSSNPEKAAEYRQGNYRSIETYSWYTHSSTHIIFALILLAAIMSSITACTVFDPTSSQFFSEYATKSLWPKKIKETFTAIHEEKTSVTFFKIAKMETIPLTYLNLLSEARQLCGDDAISKTYLKALENKDYASALRIACANCLSTHGLLLLKYLKPLQYDINEPSADGSTAYDLVSENPQIMRRLKGELRQLGARSQSDLACEPDALRVRFNA